MFPKEKYEGLIELIWNDFLHKEPKQNQVIVLVHGLFHCLMDMDFLRMVDYMKVPLCDGVVGEKISCSEQSVMSS